MPSKIKILTRKELNTTQGRLPPTQKENGIKRSISTTTEQDIMIQRKEDLFKKIRLGWQRVILIVIAMFLTIHYVTQMHMVLLLKTSKMLSIISLNTTV